MLYGSANTASDPVIPTYIFAQSHKSDSYFNFRQSHIPRTLFPNLAPCFNPFAPEPLKTPVRGIRSTACDVISFTIKDSFVR